MTTVSMHSAPRAGWPKLASAALLGLLAAGPSWTQVPVDAEGNPIDAEPVGEATDPQAEAVAQAGENLTAEELEELVGPIALYPDDLLAIVLPASAYPLQIVQAARFLEERAEDESLKPDESWDDSVVALLNYPEVIEMLNEDLEWTYALGEAVVRQQADVIAAIEAFRDRAYAAGNLKSDERQNVTRENGVIEIEPADEEVIYVPYYEPEQVVVYQPEPVYYYYSSPYPLYYYPYQYGYTFASGYFWGVTTAFHIAWLTDHLHVFHHSYWGHPYYGHTYHVGYWWYRRPSIHVHNTFYVDGHVNRPSHHERHGDFWRPRRHSGAALDRRVYREAYYADGRGRTGRDYRRTRQVLGDGTVVDRDERASRASRDADRSARFARNRSGAAVRERERTREADPERRRAADSEPDSDAIRLRARERADTLRIPDSDDIRFRSRERADVMRRVPDSEDIRSRLRERAGVDVSRDFVRRADPGDRAIERPSSRSTAPTPTFRERPSIRREAPSIDREAPSIRRESPSIQRESPSIQREAPSIRRESTPSRRVTPPSRSSESARISSRPSPSVSRAAPRVSRPSPSVSRSSPSASRSSPSVSRSSSASSRSSSSRASPEAPTSRSATRRSNRD